MKFGPAGSLVGSALASLCLIGCASASLPSTPADAAFVEGYLSASSGGVRLYPVSEGRLRSNRDCIQILRPASIQSDPLPAGRVGVGGRLGVFDDIFVLAKLQVGGDHATYELCEGRYLIVTDITPVSGN